MKFTELYKLNENNNDIAKNLERGSCPNLSDEVREKAIIFYKTHNQFKDGLDWKKDSKSFTDETFNFIDEYTSKSQQKKVKSIAIKKDGAYGFFKDVPSKNIFFKIHKEIENPNFIFVSPLTYESAVFMDSSECGGAGAKWCIGYEKSKDYWNQYVKDYGSRFVLAFNKHFAEIPDEDSEYFDEDSEQYYSRKDTELKYMIELTLDDNIVIWNQPDDEYYFDDFDLGVSEDQLLNLDFTELRKLNLNHYDWFTDLNKGVLKIPEGLTEIPDKEFAGNNIIQELYIPNSVQSIGISAFESCENLKMVNFNGKEIGAMAFRECYMLEDVSIPNIENLGESAFQSCIKLRSINLPNSLTSIKDRTFANCTNLSEVVLPANLKSIGMFAFIESKLSRVILPPSIEKMGTGAFHNIANLTYIKLPDNLKAIPSEAFSYCKNLSTIILNEGLEEIGDSAFYNCTHLTELNLPSTFKKFGHFCFTGTYITKINLPDGIEYLGCGSCSHIKELIIPKSLKSVGYHLFSNHDYKVTVKYLGTEQEWNQITTDIEGTLKSSIGGFIEKNVLISEANNLYDFIGLNEKTNDELIFLQK